MRQRETEKGETERETGETGERREERQREERQERGETGKEREETTREERERGETNRRERLREERQREERRERGETATRPSWLHPPTSRGLAMKTAPPGATPNISWWCQASGTSSPAATAACMFMVATGTAPLRIQPASQGPSLTLRRGWR